MIPKKILNPDRIRHIDGGFSFIPHRFLTDGFLEALSWQELLLYIFLVLAADRYGLSFYSDKRICLLLHMTAAQYTAARDSLIKKDLTAFEGRIFQVLSLPSGPKQCSIKKVTICERPDGIELAHVLKGTYPP